MHLDNFVDAVDYVKSQSDTSLKPEAIPGVKESAISFMDDDSDVQFYDAHETIDQEILDMLNLDKNMQTQVESETGDGASASKP